VGSDRLKDARALLALVRRGEPEDGEPLGEGRMRFGARAADAGATGTVRGPPHGHGAPEGTWNALVQPDRWRDRAIVDVFRPRQRTARSCCAFPA
jgi:hypothetical protein